MAVTATILLLNVFQMDAPGDFCVAKFGKQLPDKLEKCMTRNYAYVTSGLTLLSDKRPQRPILLMVVIGLWGCFRSVTVLPNPNLVASFTNV